ncbi:MAG: chemotaxis protein CheW [Candidatus Rokubacteria bacterium]|nr:chemotaxis protein CheW [Candidatus Rokubacteria bacterium]
MTGARQTVDWGEAYARLERARQALDAGPERAPDEARRILVERARALAKPVNEAPSPGDVLEILVFSLAGERYGIRAASVLEVIPLRELVAVPGTPRAVLGIMNHRGRILPVLDLRRVFELTGEGIGDNGRVVAAQSGGSTFGLFAETIVGVVTVGAQELSARPSGSTGGRDSFVLAVTSDMVAVLDIEVLAGDRRVTVNAEIGVTRPHTGDMPL